MEPLADQTEIARLEALWQPERMLLGRGWCPVAGVDESGRGPLAGPVVAGAVILPEGCLLASLNDSKLLTPAQREALETQILEMSLAVGMAVVEVEVIDRINILRASWNAMRQALRKLQVRPRAVLVDGWPVPRLGYKQVALVGGDRLSASVAAASILAKVARDRIMCQLDRQHPGYGFAQHKGYATPDHLERLSALGPCPVHRRSFAPVAACLQGKLPFPAAFAEMGE